MVLLYHFNVFNFFHGQNVPEEDEEFQYLTGISNTLMTNELVICCPLHRSSHASKTIACTLRYASCRHLTQYCWCLRAQLGIVGPTCCLLARSGVNAAAVQGCGVMLTTALRAAGHGGAELGADQG